MKKMAKLMFLTSLLVICAVLVNGHQPYAPSNPPTPSCTTLIYKMADCLPYLSKDAKNVTKPEASCCTGYKTVVKTDFECICEALKSSAKLGIEIDMSKAMKLPSACGDKSIHLNSCFSADDPHPPPGPHYPPSSPPSKPPTPSSPPSKPPTPSSAPSKPPTPSSPPSKPPTPSSKPPTSPPATPIKHAPKPSPKAPVPAPAPSASAAHSTTTFSLLSIVLFLSFLSMCKY